jgi:hypothetical protein
MNYGANSGPNHLPGVRFPFGTGRLISNAGRAFLFSEHCQHFEFAERGGAHSKRRAQRLGNGPK